MINLIYRLCRVSTSVVSLVPNQMRRVRFPYPAPTNMFWLKGKFIARYVYDHDRYIAKLETIPNSELERLFTKCASLGGDIELNLDEIDYKVGDEDAVYKNVQSSINARL